MAPLTPKTEVCVTTLNPKKMPANAPAGKKPGAKRRRLVALVGKKQIVGHNLDGSPNKIGSAIEGESDFCWLAGEFFVHGIERVRFDDKEHVTMMVFGFDDEADAYTARFCDNNGFSRDYLGYVDNDTWYFGGKFERVRIDLLDDGSRSRHFWERTENGRDWLAICEFESTRID